MALASRSLLAALVLIAGCAVPEGDRSKFDPANTMVAPGEGLLAARALISVPGSPLKSGYAILTLRRPDGSRVSIKSKTPGRAQSAVFLEPLPPGRYELHQLGDGQVWAPLKSLPGAFEVAAGRVTDLGALVMVFSSIELRPGMFVSDVGRFVAAQAPASEDTAVLLASLPDGIRQPLLEREPLRPSIAADPHVNGAALAYARARAGIHSRSALVPGEPIAFGRALGQVGVWHPGTEAWYALDTGRTFNVRSVAFARDGGLLAGMEQGVLMAFRGGTWSTLPPPAGNAAISFIDQADSGEYFALAEEQQAIKLLSQEGPGAAWKLERAFAVSSNGTANAALGGGRLVVILRDRSASLPEIHVLDLRTREWTSASPPADGALQVLRDGAMAATISDYMRGRRTFVSTDFGTTWEALQTDKEGSPVFLDSRTVYLLVTEKPAFMQLRTVDTVWIERSRDGGRSWESVGSLVRPVTSGMSHGATGFFALPKPGWFLSSSGTGELQVSEDEGRTWQPLRMLVPRERR